MNLVSIALDAQGADVVRPWPEAAQAEFVTLVDQHNELGKRYHLKAVPYGLMIDELGRLVKGPFSIDVGREETRALLERWLSDPAYNEVLLGEATLPSSQMEPAAREAQARFELGQVLIDLGKKEEGLAEWRKAVALDPGNWIIHKQIWAVEHPDKFYPGNVDYGWQKQQLEAEKAARTGAD